MARNPQTVPVTPEVLRWARLYRGIRSQRQAALLLGITEDTLVALENGEAQPETSLFNKLSNIYGLSESVLLLPSPPETPPLPTDYRTVGGVAVRLSLDSIQAIREAQQFQQFVSELLEDDPELLAHAKLSSHSASEIAEQIASEQRRAIGVSLDQQLRWPAGDSFNHWRVAVQAKGILVITKRMAWDECRGFSLYGANLIPTIVVNTTDAERARAFTLFHEYAHLLLEDAGICVREADSPDKRVERWCNEFAAALLVPESDVKQYVLARHPAGPDYEWPWGQIRSLATRYRVSQAVIALRLQGLSLAPQNFYEVNKPKLYGFDKPRQQERDPDKPVRIKRLPGWRERQKLEEIGIAGATAMIEAWKSQVTDAEDVANALHLSLDELFGLEERLEVERRRYRV